MAVPPSPLDRYGAAQADTEAAPADEIALAHRLRRRVAGIARYRVAQLFQVRLSNTLARQFIADK